MTMLKPLHAFYMIIAFLFAQLSQAMESRDYVPMEPALALSSPATETLIFYSPLSDMEDEEDIESPYFPKLPREMWVHIEGFLRDIDRVAFRAVCRTFLQIVKENEDFSIYFSTTLNSFEERSRRGYDGSPEEYYLFIERAFSFPLVRQQYQEQLKILITRCWLTRFCRGVDRQRVSQMAQELGAPVDETHSTTFLSLMAPIQFLKTAPRGLLGIGVASLSIGTTLASFFYQHTLVSKKNCIFPGRFTHFISFPRTTAISGESLTWEYIFYYLLYYGGEVQNIPGFLCPRIPEFPSFTTSLILQSLLPGTLLLAVGTHEAITWKQRFHIRDFEKQVEHNTRKSWIHYLRIGSSITGVVAIGLVMPWLIQYNFPDVQTLTPIGQISLDTFRNISQLNIRSWMTSIDTDYRSFGPWSQTNSSYLERLNDYDPELLPFLADHCLPNQTEWHKEWCRVIKAPWLQGSFEGSLSTISVTHLGSILTSVVLALPHGYTVLCISLYIWLIVSQFLI